MSVKGIESGGSMKMVYRIGFMAALSLLMSFGMNFVTFNANAQDQASVFEATIHPDRQLCGQMGNMCATDIDCCQQFICKAGVCDSSGPLFCEERGLPCSTATDCCSLICDGITRSCR
jgi:hypothetical protein